MVQASVLPGSEVAAGPLFSIIVPVYNTRAYVRASLQSALSQSEPGIEIIVVDDGSTDGSDEICRELAAQDDRIRFMSKVNGGQGTARNHALAHAVGRYILFLDSDDFLDADLCRIVADRFDETDADVVSFGLQFEREDGTPVARRAVSKPFVMQKPDIFPDAMLDRTFLSSPCNKAYRRSLIEDNAIRFPPLRAYEDALFSRHVAHHAARVAHIPRILYHAVTRAGSTSRGMSVRNFEIAYDLIGRERRLFHQELNNAAGEAVFGAHVVRFFSHLLVLAAFRIDDRDDRKACQTLADRAGFSAFARRRDVLDLLDSRTRLQLFVARRVGLARSLAGIAARFGIRPY